MLFRSIHVRRRAVGGVGEGPFIRGCMLGPRTSPWRTPADASVPFTHQPASLPEKAVCVSEAQLACGHCGHYHPPSRSSTATCSCARRAGTQCRAFVEKCFAAVLRTAHCLVLTRHCWLSSRLTTQSTAQATISSDVSLARSHLANILYYEL